VTNNQHCPVLHSPTINKQNISIIVGFRRSIFRIYSGVYIGSIVGRNVVLRDVDRRHRGVPQRRVVGARRPRMRDIGTASILLIAALVFEPLEIALRRCIGGEFRPRVDGALLRREIEIESRRAMLDNTGDTTIFNNCKNCRC
jgi:hypothetical protein